MQIKIGNVGVSLSIRQKLLSLVPLLCKNNNQTRRGLGRVDVGPLGARNFQHFNRNFF